jgi:predicted transposase YdaD
MCNLGEGLRERALKRGREEGREEGRKEGINTGRELNQLENLKNLMNNLKITFEEAATALGLSDADRERLAAKI